MFKRILSLVLLVLFAVDPSVGQELRRPVPRGEILEESNSISGEENLDRKLKGLTTLIKGPDLKKAERAAIVLGQMGTNAEPALSDLKMLKDHPDSSVREAIQQAIILIEQAIAQIEEITAVSEAGGGQPVDELASMRKRYQLMTIVLGENDQLAVVAAQELAEMGVEAIRCLPDLMQLRNHPNAEVKEAINQATIKIKQSETNLNRPNIPARSESSFLENLERKIGLLTQLLHGEDANKARRAATTLGRLGAYAASSLDDLNMERDHSDERVRAAVLEAIQKIETDIAQKSPTEDAQPDDAQ